MAVQRLTGYPHGERPGLTALDRWHEGSFSPRSTTLKPRVVLGGLRRGSTVEEFLMQIAIRSRIRVSEVETRESDNG
jgi:hypothetical protein